MARLRRVVWWLYGAWLLFLLIVLIATQAHGSFGRDNMKRLAPGAQRMGLWICDVGEALGADFSSIREYLTDDLYVDAFHYNGFIPQLMIVGLWALAGFLLAWTISWILGIADRHAPSSVASPSFSPGDVVTQRILAVTIFVFLLIFFSPGWPAEGPVFRLLNDALAAPARDRESAAITMELERQAQDWLPAELTPACRDILTENPNQVAAQTDPDRLRICGENVRSALEADASMGREPDPRTESASIRFLLAIAGMAKNGQLDGVKSSDGQFRAFGTFARDTYPDLRQEGWRQSAQRYLGLLQYPDDREYSQDARAETGYKLSVLTELLYNSDDPASLDMAYRIAAVTGSELSCVPEALRDATNDDGTPVAVPDLPSCLALVNATATSDASWIGLGATATKLFVSLLLLVGVAIPFIPWPASFPYVLIYLPLSVLMVVSALG